MERHQEAVDDRLRDPDVTVADLDAAMARFEQADAEQSDTEDEP